MRSSLASCFEFLMGLGDAAAEGLTPSLFSRSSGGARGILLKSRAVLTPSPELGTALEPAVLIAWHRVSCYLGCCSKPQLQESREHARLCFHA